jgi:hypothetical protein
MQDGKFAPMGATLVVARFLQGVGTKEGAHKGAPTWNRSANHLTVCTA